MRHEAISPALFTLNRERLRARLRPHSLAIAQANDLLPTNADGTAAYAPNSDLFYLTGVEQEESILMLAPEAHDEKQREILFLRETNETIAQWEGHKLTKEEARARTGVAQVKWLSEFPSIFRGLMCEVEHVYLNTNEHRRALVKGESRDERFVHETQRRYPLHRYHRLARIMHDLRTEKSDREFALIRKAVEITAAGFERVARFTRPGVNECEIEAEFAHEFIRQRARFAYQPIIASGRNACVLHYVENDQPCRKGELLLLDVGASYGNYNADVTRTLPVSGRFNPRQKQVYGAVLRVLRQSIDGLRPGKLPREWQKEAEASMQEELLKMGLIKRRDLKKQDPDRPALKKYFMHGIGHPLGLDVHDVATTGAAFAPGWVMTIEPGIYIPDEDLAVRLEENVLITEDRNVNLTAEIPIEIDAVEALMKR